MPIDSILIDVTTGGDDPRPGRRAFVVLIGRDGAGRPVDLASESVALPVSSSSSLGVSFAVTKIR